MKTIMTQNIDGIDIIRKIGNVNGLIDPEATKKIVAVKITETDVHKQIHAIQKQMSIYARQALQAKKNEKAAITPQEKKKFFDERMGRYFQMKEEEEKLKPLAVEYKKEYKKLISGDDAVYFNPRAGEEIVEDDEAERIKEKMITATENNKLLARDETEVDNYVGKTFWKLISGTWKKTDIITIGIAPVSGAIESKNLTDEQQVEISEQLENERIAGLSPLECATEKERMITGLVSRAGAMKTEFDVLGDNDALSKAQAWLADETVIVEARYQ